MNTIEGFLQNLAASLQVVKIYTPVHPKAKAAINAAFCSLEEILRHRAPVTIGIVNKELACGQDIYFDLSQRLKSFIDDMAVLGVEKLVFEQGVVQDSFEEFVIALSKKKEETGQDFLAYFRDLRVEGISLEKIGISASSDSSLRVQEGEKQTQEELTAIFGSILDGSFLEHRRAKALLEAKLKKVKEGRWDFLALAPIKEHDLATFVHSLNVSVLAMFFASKIGFSREDVFAIGIAALFHDMGKIAISRAVLQKPGSLDEKEFEYVKSHTVLGAQVLLDYVESLGFLPVIVAFEHHIRYDLTGYPKLHRPFKPHQISLLVSLCDCYDALRGRRNYKNDYLPETIYEIMRKERGALFDPALFDLFFETVGIYPVGTIVRLSDSAIAVVRGQTRGVLSSPQVEIVEPENRKKTLIDLSQDTSVTIQSSLNPLTQGKQYVPFV